MEGETPQDYEKLYLSEVIALHAQLLITLAVTSPCCISSVAWRIVMHTWFIQLSHVHQQHNDDYDCL